MLKRDSLVEGAFILTAGALLSRVLGAVYRFFLPGLLGGGEEGAYGVGLYGYAYQIYIVALTLSTVGLPLAISKLVSQRLAEGDRDGAMQVFDTSRRLLGSLGLLLTFALIVSAPVFGRFLDPNATYSIIAVAPAVFFVSYMSSYRGLFQGLQIMTPYAASQVYEQLVRIVTIIGSAILLLPYGIEWAAAGANFGAVSGAVVALAYLIYVYRRHRDDLASYLGRQPASRRRHREVVRELLTLAIPISLAGLAFPLFGLVDLLFVPIRLQAKGFSPAEATTAYGALTQQAAPFINVPLSFTTGFALALVPAIAEAAVLRHAERVRRRVGTSLRIALIITLPAVVGLMVLARDLTSALFDYPEAGGALQVQALAAVFIGLQQMSSGVLQGLGLPMLPVRNLLAGVIVKAVLTWYLAGWPGWEIEGVALATVIGFAVSGTLNLTSVRRRTGGLGLSPGDLVRMLAAAGLMGASVAVLRRVLPAVTGPSISGVLVLGLLVLSGALVYTGLVIGFGGITEQDFEHFPRLRALAKRLRRWGLLRR